MDCRQTCFWTLLIGVVLWSFTATHAWAQQWPLGHQPLQYTVPQYRSPSSARSYLSPPNQLGQPPTGYPTQQVPESLDKGSSWVNQRRPNELPPSVFPQQSQAYPLFDSPESINGTVQQPSELLPAAPNTQILDGGVHPGGVHPSLPNSTLETQSTMNQPAPTGALLKSRPRIDYSIYRDPNSYPLDPRKPCNECVRPPLDEVCRCQWPGKNGRPYQDSEPGGCECSNASKKEKGNFSLNWPGPLTSFRQMPQGQFSDDPRVSRTRLNDRFNHLADFKLIDFRRTDSGHCGPGADRYGCLGESRVAGVGFRQPSEPAVAPFR